jgi:PAS domain S-box-containing protein
MAKTASAERVLIIAPVGGDALNIPSMLQAEGISTCSCADPEECLNELADGAGALLITEEVLEMSCSSDLLGALKAQPTWSDLPVIVLTTGEESRVVRLLELTARAGCRVTLLEQPTYRAKLLRSVEAALISRRRQYQVRDLMSELRESEERFRLMADGVPLMIWVHDAQGQQQFVNHTFCEFFGVASVEMTGARWQSLMHPEDADIYARKFATCVHERRPFEGETRVRRADGQWRWLHSWARPRVDASGKFVGMVGTSADVTERKNLESELHHHTLQLAELNVTLDRRVKDRTAELQELTRELAQIEHRERKRLAQLLHDGLQQFLVASRNYVELLSSKPQESRKSREVLYSKLNTLLNEAISSSRTLTFELSPPCLEEGLVPALEWLTRWMAEMHLFDVQLTASPDAELNDPLQRLIVFQCARELLLNVVKHSGTKRAEVRLWRDADGMVFLEVNDQGRGFDAQTALEKRCGNLGLGMISQRMEVLGGSVEVNAVLGQGVRIRLRVPALPLESLGKPQPADMAASI